MWLMMWAIWKFRLRGSRTMDKGSTLDFFARIYRRMYEDEELMRLLTYDPMGYRDGKYYKDPLDGTLPNIVDQDSDTYWELVDERVVLGEKSSDLETKAICRVYVYEGRIREVFGNYHFLTQEVNVDIFIHEKFDKDLRLSRIKDRVAELIALERLAGYNRLDYKAGNPREAPTHYRRFLHQYEMLVKKK